GAGAVGVSGEHGVAPVVAAGVGVVGGVAGGKEDLVELGAVEHGRARPHRRLDAGGTVGGPGGLDEMDRLVAALGVEHVLRAGRQVDRGDVTLVVAGVARVAAVGDVEILGAAVGDRYRERRRALFTLRLEGVH